MVWTNHRAAIIRVHHQLAAHVPATVFLAQVAVNRERARLIGPELEGDRLAAVDELGDAVGVYREGAPDVFAAQRDAHEVVLVTSIRPGSKANFFAVTETCRYTGARSCARMPANGRLPSPNTGERCPIRELR